MSWGSRIPLLLVWTALVATALPAQIAVSGRVLDDTGAAVPGTRVELRAITGGEPVVVSSDAAGNFKVRLPSSGEYRVRAERLGFYLYQGTPRFEPAETELTIVLNHLQDFSDRIDVTYSPPAIDPAQPADRRELDNTEMQAVPYPAPQDYRNSLPLIDGVVQDNNGLVHFNGGNTNQTSYSMDGFNIANPVNGQLETRVNIGSIQSMEVETSRSSADMGRGSSGSLDLKTRMGDDRFRFGATNFIPGLSTDSGLYLNKWTPRVELSGPISRGRAWFHDGFDAFYSDDVVHGLPAGQDHATALTSSNVTRFQVNLTPSNILTGSFLYNLADAGRAGLSLLRPVETTVDIRQRLYMSTLRDQVYVNGAMLDIGFADTRGLERDAPRGTQLYEITPSGNRGNYFSDLNRHFYRQQWISNLFLPDLKLFGTHRLKFGIDFERESFAQETTRHDYVVLRADNTEARHVTFLGQPYQERKNFEGAQYFQDAWAPREDILVEAGIRLEWNEIVRDLEMAPRVAVAWAPKALSDTKFSAGWGIYYDAISLETIARHQDQTSIATFYQPGGAVQEQTASAFLVNDHSLIAPYARTASFTVERKMPGAFYLKSSYTRRIGNHAFAFVPYAQAGRTNYELANARRERYHAYDVSLRHTFAGKFEWFGGYTRSSARSSAAMDYSLDNPVFGSQGPGPYAWDAPNRFHTWGWAPLPRLGFLTRNTTAAYLVEYRTGFPFSVVHDNSYLDGPPNSQRLPDYFSINLHFERQFRALHYLWAWRFGFNNLTNNGNPNNVNNIRESPAYLTYGRGQSRAFSVRLRLLGRR